MALISKKKQTFKISPGLGEYLKAYDREVEIELKYSDLLRYNSSIPLYDKKNVDTLWETVFYAQAEHESIHYNLRKIYSILKADGDISVMNHLYVDRIDLCVYGNTQPFRIRIVNKINDNFDYFYVKNADASRVYGLELEDILSPNRISYLVYGQTLIEEHIAGIPGDQFFKHYLHEKTLNPIRLAKEFVKFNERCFVRLLGDMHSNNFVVVVTPDFEEVHYRIRAIDFDQQSYESRKAVYLPQYFKQNNPLIELGIKLMTSETVRQYQKEERTLIAHRIKTSQTRLKALLDAMCSDRISQPENVEKLKKELARHYNEERFLNCKNMGSILRTSLLLLLQKEI